MCKGALEEFPATLDGITRLAISDIKTLSGDFHAVHYCRVLTAITDEGKTYKLNLYGSINALRTIHDEGISHGH